MEMQQHQQRITTTRRWIIKDTTKLGREGIMAITRIIAGLITNTTMVTTTIINSTTGEVINSMIDAMIVVEEDMNSKGTTIGIMTKTDSNQGVMTRTGSTNGSKRIATLSRLLGGILCQAMCTLLASSNTAGRGMTATNVEVLRTMIVFSEITRNSPITPLEIPCLTLRCCRSVRSWEGKEESMSNARMSMLGS